MSHGWESGKGPPAIVTQVPVLYALVAASGTAHDTSPSVREHTNRELHGTLKANVLKFYNTDHR